MYRPCRLCRLPSKLQRRARRSRLFTMILVIVLFLLLAAPFYIVYKPPTLLIRYFEHRWPNVLWHVATSQKIVALTIDDAPSAYTREILQILKENDAAATFFVIGGQVEERGDEGKQILKEIVESGNELGNHAMHDEPSRSLADSELISQIDSVDKMIRTAYSQAEAPPPPRYFRPGSGFFSQRMLDRMSMLNYRLVLGNIYPHDPQIPYWRINARHVLSMLQPGGIIICHDRRGWTPPMLKYVLKEMKRKGWHVTTVTGLINQAPGVVRRSID